MKIKKRKFDAKILHSYETGYAHGQTSVWRIRDDRVEKLRARCETLESSPEIKADTEAAFKRGVGHGKMLARTTVIAALTQMDTGLDPMPVPSIEPLIVPQLKPPSARAGEGSGMRDPEAAE